MATVKVTFTLDPVTLERLQDTASRLAMPKSEVVREAIMEFHERLGRLSNRERLAMLRSFDKLVPKIPVRGAAAIDRELAEVRRSRKSGGRRTPLQKRG
ncbi:MAG: ribbon-helix-helix protein, CopG family [Bryobacteraceae bacterium]